MLERTTSCLESASQLLFRCLDPPLRSGRVLGPSFWKNGGDDLHLPPWWPAYLNSVRAVPQSDTPRRLPTDRPDLNSLLSPRLFCRPRLSRSYTKYGRLQQTSISIKQEEEHDDPHDLSTEFDRLDNLAYEDPESEAISYESSQSIEEVEDEESPPQTTPAVLERAQLMQNPIQDLQAMLDHYTLPHNPPDKRAFDVVKQLFRRLPNQADHASQVLRFLFLSSREADLISAVRIFSLIPVENRTRDDYSCAVQASLKASLFFPARQINSEATSRGMNEDCSPFVLLFSVSKRMWSLAANIWRDSYHFTHQYRRSVDLQLSAGFEASQNLPPAILELGRILKSNSPIIASIRGFLALLGINLVRLLVSSGPLMSDITPKGLLEIFEAYSPPPNTYLLAINTLLKSANRSDKAALSLILYRRLRSFHSDFHPSPAIFGALISMHCAERAPAHKLYYLLDQFSSFHQVVDRRGYQRVLGALADQGDVEATQKVFLDLCRVHGRPTDPAYYTPLIYAYARLADAAGAEHIFRLMKSWGVERNTHCWNILLYAYVRSGRFEQALQHFENMTAQAIVPDSHTFGMLMSIHSRSGNTNEILKVIELAQGHKIEGGYEMIAALVHSYCLNDEVETAIKLARVTTEADFVGSPVKMWNQILKHFAFQAQSEKVLQIQQEMKDLGVAPDDMTYAALMTALIMVGKAADAARILRVLNISQRLVATRLHYAILLQGYVFEDDRDMAHVIYTEMLERFPRVGSSARLSMLRLEGKIAQKSSPGGSFKDVSDYLADVLSQTSYADRATKEPQPGFRRRKPVDAVPSVYITYLANILLYKGRVRQADRLLQRFSSLVGSSYLNTTQDEIQSIEYLTFRLATSISAQNWSAVEESWTRILSLGLRLAQPVVVTKRTPDVNADHDPQDTLHQGRFIHNLNLLDHEGFEFRTMIAGESNPGNVNGSYPSPKSPLDKLTSKVLFSQRYILKAAITKYLSALDQQHLYQKAIETVGQLEAVGFALTSKNLNFYIQLLTRSSHTDHKILAFKLYEERLLANTPPWALLRRGLWISPSDIPEGHESVSPSEAKIRRAIESRNPGQLMPTYWTTVYLAAVLYAFQRLSHQGNIVPLSSVWENARGTFEFIRRLPLLRDRIQGVILRGLKLVRGDIQKRVRQPRRPDRAGLLGSKSPVDHVPADEVADLDKIIARMEPDLNNILAASTSNVKSIAISKGPEVTAPNLKRYESVDKSVIRDQVPAHAIITDIADVQEAIASQGEPAETQTAKLSAPNMRDQIIQQAERFEGDLTRSPVWSDRLRQLEVEETQRNRLQRQERKLLETMSTIRRDLKLPRVMSNLRFGRPSAKSEAQDILPPAGSPGHGSLLYSLRNWDFEKDAELKKREQDLRTAALGNISMDGERSTLRVNPRKLKVPIKNKNKKPESHALSKLPRGPYSKRSLRWVSHNGSRLDVKLKMRLTPFSRLPKSTVRAFWKDKATRARRALWDKEEQEKIEQMVEEARQYEMAWKSDQHLVYNKVAEQVEMNRLAEEARKVIKEKKDKDAAARPTRGDRQVLHGIMKKEMKQQEAREGKAQQEEDNNNKEN